MYSLDNGARLVIPRTELTFPAHMMRMHSNAAAAAVDHIMADFEDACPPDFKGKPSRDIVVESFNTTDFGNKVVTFRPNNIHSQYFLGDVSALIQGAPDKFHGIILPKIETPEEIAYVDNLLTALEREAGWTTKISLEVLIESPLALVNSYQIATASDRMVGLIFGLADFAASIGVREVVQDQNQSFHYAKQAVVVSAKAAGLHAMDNVFFTLVRGDTSDEDAEVIRDNFRKKNSGAARMGMDGTWVIHPQQAEIANEVYSPTDEEIDEDVRSIDYYHAQGGGALVFPETNEFLDEATIKGKLATLAKGVQSGKVSKEYLADAVAKSEAVTGFSNIDVHKRII